MKNRILTGMGAAAMTLAFAAVQGVIVQQVVIRPLLGAPIINAVIATLGLNLALHSVAGMIWGNQTNVLTSPVADLPVFQLVGALVPCEIDDLVGDLLKERSALARDFA
jgi:branched-subunit amino acid ABC-type transport system permease component